MRGWIGGNSSGNITGGTVFSMPRGAGCQIGCGALLFWGALIALVILLSSCNNAPPAGQNLTKYCDGTRLVYLYKRYNAGGIAVVENAPECRKRRK